MKKFAFLLGLTLAARLLSAQTTVALTVGLHGNSVTPAFVAHPDTVQRVKSGKTGVALGFVAQVPLSKYLFFQAGVVYAVKGSNQTQFFDTSRLYQRTLNLPTEQKGVVRSINTQLTASYMDVPLNLVLGLPLGGKRRLVVGAGPQASIFFNGNTAVQSVLVSQSTPDRNSQRTTVERTENKDLPVGNGNRQYRVVHLGANALAGLTLNRVTLALHYSTGLTPFYEEDGKEYKLGTLGARLAIAIGKAGEK